MKKYFILFFCLCTVLSVRGQNVGIGTTTPTEKLQVDGNILTDTVKLNAMLLAPNAGAGKILTSDDIGNAIWQDNTSIPVSSSDSDGSEGYGQWGDCSLTGNITGYHPVANTNVSSASYFGYATAISGNQAMVSAYFDTDQFYQQGSVSFYSYSDNKWSLLQKLTDPDAEASDLFGYSVAMFENFAIVGVLSDNINGLSDQGSAVIYQFNGASWEFLEKITDPDGDASDHFGRSVAISGEYAVVGAASDKVGGNNYQGSVSVFHFNGTNWEWMQKITDPNGQVNDFFGNSVSISGDRFVVGCKLCGNTNAGSANIYHLEGSAWELDATLLEIDSQDGDLFGSSVAIAGINVLIGAPNDNVGSHYGQGSACTYYFNGTAWLALEKIVPIYPGDYEEFGSSVNLSGEYALIGQPEDEVGGGKKGSAALYLRLANRLSRLQYVTDPMGIQYDKFGFSTSLDGETGRFLIGGYEFADYKGKAVFGKIK